MGSRFSSDSGSVAWLLGENKNTIQRIFQIKGWQVRKRKSGHRPRVQSLPSAASRPNERWATDMARVWCGEQHRWLPFHQAMENDPAAALRGIIGLWRIAWMAIEPDR